MKEVERKIAKIGNSWGIRFTREEMKRYGFKAGGSVILEEGPFSIKVKTSSTPDKLSLEETVLQAAQEDESWDDFEGTCADGLEDL